MKKFIDFILDAQMDMRLFADFVIVDDERELKDFFQANGYDGIPEEEIAKIFKAKKIHQRMQAHGQRSY
jgi:hypothetical protein